MQRDDIMRMLMVYTVNFFYRNSGVTGYDSHMIIIGKTIFHLIDSVYTPSVANPKDYYYMYAKSNDAAYKLERFFTPKLQTKEKTTRNYPVQRKGEPICR